MTARTSTCLNCGGVNLSPVRRYRTNSREGRALFGGRRLEECPVCGLVQLKPLPSATLLDT